MVVDDRISGVELLALYGDERVGAFLPGFKKAWNKAGKVAKTAWGYTPEGAAINYANKHNLWNKAGKVAKTAWGYTPEGYAINRISNMRKKRRLHGDDSRLGEFLPGLKNVGKYTNSITTGVTKSFIPPYLVDAMSKMDPTKKGASVSSAVTAINTSDKKKSFVPNSVFGIDTKKIAIVGGGAIGALIVLKILMSRRSRS